MRKFLITVFFVAFVATPLAAQPMSAPPPAMKPVATTPAMRAALRPVAMRPAPAPVMARPATMAAAPVSMAPSMAVEAPMSAPAPVARTAAMAPPTQPTMSAAPPKTAAKSVEKDSKGSVFGGWVLEMLLYLVGALLTVLIPVLTAWVYKKLKLTDLQSKEMVDSIVLKAAQFGLGKAEEEAHKLHDDPMDSAKKMDLALSSANKYLRDSGIPEKSAGYLADLIESQLGVTRANGATKPKESPAEDDEKPAEDKKEGDKEEKSDDK